MDLKVKPYMIKSFVLDLLGCVVVLYVCTVSSMNLLNIGQQNKA